MRAAWLIVLASCSSAPHVPVEPLATTDALIAVGNLEGELSAGESILRRQPGNALVMAQLASQYLTHGQLVGKLADYDRAEELVTRAVALRPGEPRVWAARAAVHSRFHEFDQALAALTHAEEVEPERASILHAQGRFAEARPIREKWARGLPRLETLSALATLDADEGRVDEAEQHFAEAEAAFREVSPFPLVWLWLQEATLFSSVGEVARARERLEAAHRRVPQDVSVASHLAAMSDRERALELLRQIVAVSDDPEHLAALGELSNDDQLQARAAARYEELLKRHPAAFADHAARFYLQRDAARASFLAELNLRARQTPESFALAVEAANAAAQTGRACQLADEALRRFAAGQRLKLVAYTAFDRCDQKARAQATLQSL